MRSRKRLARRVATRPLRGLAPSEPDVHDWDGGVGLGGYPERTGASMDPVPA